MSNNIMRFFEKSLIFIFTLFVGLFITKSYIANNEYIVDKNDVVMNRFMKRIKIINKFRFILYIIIGPIILIYLLAFFANFIF